MKQQFKKLVTKTPATILLIALLMVAILFAGSVFTNRTEIASAHPMIYFEYWDLVDSGNHMDWKGSTKYMTQWNNAVAQWNKVGQFINSSIIRKDSIKCIADVKISDVSKSDVNWVGMTEYGEVLGRIKFNTYYLDQSRYTNDQIIHTCLHEIGHGLGLIHGYGNVMSETEWPATLDGSDSAELHCVYERWWK